MKIRVNTEIISSLSPCKDRLDNWKKYYNDFNDDILKFLEKTNITETDKIWVCCRIMPRFLVEVFAIDCAFAADAAAAYAAAAYAAAYAADAAAADAAAAYAAAAYAAAYAADAAAAYAAAAYAADAADVRKEQVEVLKYLIRTHKEQE